VQIVLGDGPGLSVQNNVFNFLPKPGDAPQSQRSGLHRLLLNGTLLAVAAVCALILTNRAATDAEGTLTRWLLLVPLGITGTAAAIAVIRGARAPKGGGGETGSPQEQAGRLADVWALHVANQWWPEYQRRVGDTSSPLAVAWRSTSDRRALPLADIARASGRLPSQYSKVQHPPVSVREAERPVDPLVGIGSDLAGLFVHKVHSGRLVVLGTSGSGKTVLLIRLVLDLIEGRSPGAPVPVLVPAVGWDPDREGLWDWIGRKAMETDPWLTDCPSADDPDVTRFDLLRQHSRILPILDGIDELSAPAMHDALRKIESSLRNSEGIVVSSQTRPYTELMDSPDGRRLSQAPGIEISALDADESFAYLIARAANDDADQWRSVRAAAEPGSALAEVFSTALMVSLADRIYNPGPEPLSRLRERPTHLLSVGQEADAVQAYLVESFVPAAYRSSRRPARAGSESAGRFRSGRVATADAERWLTVLARTMQTTGPGRASFAWWELADAAPAWWPAVVVGLLGAVPAGLAGWVNPPSGVGLGVGLVTALCIGLGTRRLVGRHWPEHPYLIESSAGAVGAGLISGLVGGMLGASFREAGALGGITGGIAIGFGVGAITGALPGFVGGLIGAFFGEVLAGHGHGWPAGAASALGAAVTLGIVTRKTGRRIPVRGGTWAASGLYRGLVVGGVMSAAIGLGTVHRKGAVIGSVAALVAFTALGLMAGLTSESAIPDQATTSMQNVLRADRLTFWLFALVGGISGLLAIFLVNPRVAIAGGICGALGLSFFQAAWGRYVLARLWFASRRELPLDLIGFLEDARRRDVLRQVGSRYEFRHAQLRQHFETRSTSVRSQNNS
jgi:NACHT domain-containing protein